MESLSEEEAKKHALLGIALPEATPLPELAALTSMWEGDAEFRVQTWRQQSERIHAALLAALRGAPSPAFLLPTLVDIAEKLNRSGTLKREYLFSSFELWLRLHVSVEEQFSLRAKVVGRFVPREVYQRLFPVGRDSRWPGSHIVSAHRFPDADAVVTSFWGWVDAFGAMVSEGQHYWWLPSPTFTLPMMRSFQSILGDGVFSLAQTSSTLLIGGQDLFTEEGVRCHSGSSSLMEIEHAMPDQVVLVVGEDGSFLGSWLPSDAEAVRQVALPFKALFHAFEKAFITELTALFSREQLTFSEFEAHIQSLLERPLASYEELTASFPAQQRTLLEALLMILLGLEEGSGATVEGLAGALADAGSGALTALFERLKGGEGIATLFGGDGQLVAQRTELFTVMGALLEALDYAIWEARSWIERLDISLVIRKELLGIREVTATLLSDIDELAAKLERRAVLPILEEEVVGGAPRYAVGVIRRHALTQPLLATVSLRDFSSSADLRMPREVGVISILDHHRSALTTSQPAVIVTGDVQACAVLAAEQALAINDEARTAAAYGGYVHPARELSEYLSYLHATFDDTDLLSKTTARDVVCVAELVNRLHAHCQPGVEPLVSLADIEPGPEFSQRASERLLRLPFVYDLYKAIYRLRAEEIERQIIDAAEGNVAELFCDVKEHNGCCRVGQIKLFSATHMHFLQVEETLRSRWTEASVQLHRHRPEMDLHMEMVSTIPSAEEVFRGEEEEEGSGFRDELWVWVPERRRAYDHLGIFLHGFCNSQPFVDGEFTAVIDEAAGGELVLLVQQFFPGVSKAPLNGPKLLLACRRGAINSRKRMVAPYLPKGDE